MRPAEFSLQSERSRCRSAELAYARGAGATFAQLAAKYGVSIMTVFRRLRAAQE